MAELYGEMADELYSIWWNIATGRDTASIILMGSFVELALAEVLYVHKYQNFWGELDSLIKYHRHLEIVKPSLLDWADNFRRDHRNLWAHHKGHEITEGATLPVAEITVPTGDSEAMLKALKEATTNAAKLMRPKSTADIPALRWPMKKAAAERLAAKQYDEVWKWLDELTARYLRNKHYEIIHAKYGGPRPELVRFKGGKVKPV